MIYKTVRNVLTHQRKSLTQEAMNSIEISAGGLKRVNGTS